MIFHGGQIIGKGYFLNLGSGKVETISRDGDYLPGNTQVTYIRIPAPLMLVTGPLIGLIYVISFLPFMCITFLYVLCLWGVNKVKAAPIS